jgi:hypothetical protein
MPYAPLVVIIYFDFVSVPSTPPKADSPLVVHTNTVLTATISRKLLQPISGRDTQFVERLDGI